MNYEKLRMSQELQDYIWGNMREKIHAKFKEKESALYKEFLLAFYKEVDVPEEVIENIFKWEGSAERKWRTENNISYTIKLVNVRKNYLPHEDIRHEVIRNYDALVGPMMRSSMIKTRRRRNIRAKTNYTCVWAVSLQVKSVLMSFFCFLPIIQRLKSG